MAKKPEQPPRKADWKALVKAAEPKPTRDVEYEFSNGRKFYSRKAS